MINKIKEYYPRDLDSFLGNDHSKSYFRKYIEQGEARNFVIYGLPGLGKTTFAKLLGLEISPDMYYFDLVRNYTSGDYSDLVDVLNFPDRKVIILDNARFLSEDYFDMFKSYFEEDSLLTSIFIYGKYSDIPESVSNLAISTELEIVPGDVLYDFIKSISDKENWGLTEDVLKDILIRSKGEVCKVFKILQDIIVLGLYNQDLYFKHFKPRVDQHFEDLIYYIRDKKRVSSILEYLLTRYTSQDIYRLFSEYCLYYYERPDSKLYKKLGNRLLIYSKEILRLSKGSNTTTELYCDIYLLEAFVADNPEYKSIVDMALVLPETERERRQAHVIKHMEAPAIKKEESTKTSVEYLSAEALANKLGALIVGSTKEG